MRNFALYGLSIAAAAMLAGCGGSQPPIGQPGAVPQTFVTTAYAERGGSWMLPEAAAKKSILVYVAEMHRRGVFVYDYKSGKRVGALTGLHDPAGECVDAKGDVYVTEFGSGEVTEYAHGGTLPIKKWTTNGNAFGCSVDKMNDLAVADSYTNSGPGQIEIFPKGGSKGRTYADPRVCYEIWPPGYDDNGDLIAECGLNGVAIVAVLHGASRLVRLSYSGLIQQPGGVIWDGKYITLTDHIASPNGPTIIVQATLSDKALTKVGETVLTDNCNSEDYAEIVAPFIVGKKNTPVNASQGTAVLGADVDCNNTVGVWHYPKGGEPFREIGKSGSGLGYTQVVSIGQ